MWPAIIGGGVSLIGSIIGGNKSSDAARQQAQLSNEAAERQLKYDTDRWNLTKEKIIADRNFASEQILLQAANERKLADYKDAVNLEQYKYNLKIRDSEQQSLDAQFDKSNAIYDLSIDLNALQAKSATDDEIRKYQELQDEAAFDTQEQQLEQLEIEGKLRARGIKGRSVSKGIQSSYASYGRQIALLNASVEAGGRNARAAMAEIARDRTSADLAAFASKMLEPGILPDPVQPFATPVADYQLPRELTEGDFGPRPVLGAYSSPSAAANQVWGSTFTSIASNVGGIVSAFTKSG